MDTQQNFKKKYVAPTLEWIALDNNISLALESSPPVGPGESRNLAPEYLDADPYKTKLS
jgi:hypothetical protein